MDLTEKEKAYVKTLIDMAIYLSDMKTKENKEFAQIHESLFHKLKLNG